MANETKGDTKRAKHTPGEWYAEDRVERYVILAEGVDYEIASVEDGASAEESGRPAGNAEADASLIAQAPAMYEALLRIYDAAAVGRSDRLIMRLASDALAAIEGEVSR